MQDHSDIRPVSVFAYTLRHKRIFPRRTWARLTPQVQCSVLNNLLCGQRSHLGAQLITPLIGCIQKLFQQTLFPYAEFSEFWNHLCPRNANPNYRKIAGAYVLIRRSTAETINTRAIHGTFCNNGDVNIRSNGFERLTPTTWNSAIHSRTSASIRASTSA
jgi:hypothetical protein